jgi:hypothetical protein
MPFLPCSPICKTSVLDCLPITQVFNRSLTKNGQSVTILDHSCKPCYNYYAI